MRRQGRGNSVPNHIHMQENPSRCQGLDKINGTANMFKVHYAWPWYLHDLSL